MKEHKRGSFSGNVGFVMAAAGSAVGLGNIWRFPYLAAKDGGGRFLFFYIILALTFGFALLTTEVAIGRKTRKSPLTAYGAINKKLKGIGVIACLVPTLILPYYSQIGGWVLKYCVTYITGNGNEAVKDGYFTGFITAQGSPIAYGIVFLIITAGVVYLGVDKGIEKYSKILMPILLVLIIGISLYSLTISHTAADGVTRTGIEGLKVYLLPDFTGITFKELFITVMEAMGQLFYSISVAMGIMIAYGSYVKKDMNLLQSINHIEFFDTLVAFLAGMMIIPAIYVFSGQEGMSAGPGLMFISLPKVFQAMGGAGTIIGALFFIMVAFAAVTSSISVMEAIVSSAMDYFKFSRRKSAIIVAIYSVIGIVVVCFGYNRWYFELPLPNGAIGQILDVMDYVSNNIMMPVVALATCILIGWIAKPETVIEEVTIGGVKFRRRRLYIVMIKYVVPLMLVALLLQALGIIKL